MGYDSTAGVWYVAPVVWEWMGVLDGRRGALGRYSVRWCTPCPIRRSTGVRVLCWTALVPASHTPPPSPPARTQSRPSA